METRYARLTELRKVARYMRDRQCNVLSTTCSVIAFVRHEGKVLLTLNDDGEIVGLCAFVHIERTDGLFGWENFLLVQAIVVSDHTDAPMTDSMRLALHAVLSVKKATYATTAVMAGVHRDYEGMMLALGFLCEDCGGATHCYVMRNDANHTGAVIIERIMSGCEETLVEV